jgi:O-succinylbenzoic acid--CoA ligase
VYDGVPIGNTQMAVVDGRVELAGSVLAEAYLDDPRRTAYAFREHDGHRWYHTDDIGTINGGRLEVTGRVDDLIISGGIKVSLSEVEGVVRGLVGLADAVVVSIPQAEWGEVPFVVTTGTMPLDALRDAVSLRLGPAAAPARILKMDALPTLATGKPDRLAIAALALSQS